MKDWRGVEMHIGSWVVYPTTLGRSPIMKQGRIQRLEIEYRGYWTRHSNSERERVIKSILHVGIWPEDKYSYGKRWEFSHTPPKRLSYPLARNITVIKEV